MLLFSKPREKSVSVSKKVFRFMAEDLHLWTIIDLDERRIPELKRLESLLNDLSVDSSNEDKLINHADTLIRILELVCKQAYPLFPTIDLTKRQALLTRVMQQWQEFRKEMKRILPRSTWETLQDHAQVFSKLCTFDFEQRPLMFAKQALAYKDMPIELESKLIALIETMRKQHPKILDDILKEEYERINRRDRKNIVVTVLGSTKASKSSLINFLLEQEICPTGNRAATARLTRIIYGKCIRLTVIGSEHTSFVFSNTEQLLIKAQEVIILKNEDRKSRLCEDEVFIELPIDALKGLELWDVPGFDENHVINNRIQEILQKTDLILAVLSQQESLRQTSIEFIKPCLESSDNSRPQTKICFIISQIDRYRSDEQNPESREAFLQHIYDKICSELPMNFPKIPYKDSEQFIPMCSHPRHHIKDYLECRESFISKSCQWFGQALHRFTFVRTDLLLKCVEEFRNYENLFLQQARFQRMKKIFNEHFHHFSLKLPEKIKRKLNEIHQLMKQSIDPLVIQCRDMFYQSTNLGTIEQNIQTQLKREFEKILARKNPEIVEMIDELSVEFFDKIELKPAEIQNLKRVLNETLNRDYYTNVIGQYNHTSPYHLSAYFSRIFQALSDTLKATIKIPYGEFERVRQAYDQITKREKYLEQKTTESINELVIEVLEVISDKVHRETEKTLRTILHHQLQTIEKHIEKQSKMYLHSSINDTKINHLRQFSKDHTRQIKQLHLDILDVQFQLDFSDQYQIDFQERLDQNNHFEVFAGTVREDKHPMAMKLIPLDDFQLQEVLYIRETKHKNVIKYYGVKKGADDHYYLIMRRFDCNLSQYLNNHQGSIDPSIIDNMIIQIIEGLNYIHTQLEVIHYNLRLENILVHEKKNRFLIGQFGGVYRQIDQYFAPDFRLSDHSSIHEGKYDIFSLGVTIREIIRLAYLPDHCDRRIKDWLKISDKCCEQQPSARPTCSKLLEYHVRRNQ